MLIHFLECVRVFLNKGNLKFGVLHLSVSANPARPVKWPVTHAPRPLNAARTGHPCYSGCQRTALLVFEDEENLKAIMTREAKKYHFRLQLSFPLQ